jgi:hypothetical protein
MNRRSAGNRRRAGADQPGVWNSIVRRAAAYLLIAVLAGCGGSDNPPEQSPTPPATGQPGQSPGPTAELIELSIVDGRVEPALDRVEVALGATVRIVVGSDVPDEVHLHGYDLVAPVSPDQDAVIEFVAEQPGLYELETHEQGLVLLQLQVQ